MLYSLISRSLVYFDALSVSYACAAAHGRLLIRILVSGGGWTTLSTLSGACVGRKRVLTAGVGWENPQRGWVAHCSWRGSPSGVAGWQWEAQRSVFRLDDAGRKGLVEEWRASAATKEAALKASTAGATDDDDASSEHVAGGGGELHAADAADGAVAEGEASPTADRARDRRDTAAAAAASASSSISSPTAAAVAEDHPALQPADVVRCTSAEKLRRSGFDAALFTAAATSMRKGEVCALEHADGRRFELTLHGWVEERALTRDGGVVKRMVAEGDGWDKPKDGSEVAVLFGCWIARDGGGRGAAVVGPAPALNFTIGDEEVVEGLEVGVATMRAGEECELLVRSAYAFGGSGNRLLRVPPGADLVYRVRLLSFVKAREPWDMTAAERLAAAQRRQSEGEVRLSCSVCLVLCWRVRVCVTSNAFN